MSRCKPGSAWNDPETGPDAQSCSLAQRRLKGCLSQSWPCEHGLIYKEVFLASPEDQRRGSRCHGNSCNLSFLSILVDL